VALIEIIDAWVRAVFRFAPHEATAKGLHAVDHLLPTFDGESQAALRSARDTARAALAHVDQSALSADDRLDLAVLGGHLESALFLFDEGGWHATNPYLYVEAWVDAMEGLERSVSLDDDARRRALSARVAMLPRAVDAMLAEVEAPMSPYVESALSVLEETIGEVETWRAMGDLDAELTGAAQRALERAENELSRRPAIPFAAMGEARYRRLLEVKHHLTLSLEDIESMARRALERAKSALATDEEEPDAGPPPEGFSRADVLAYYADEMEHVRAFIDERGLLTLPATRVRLREMPPHVAAASPPIFYEPPPAFAPGVGYFFIRPIPDPMDDDEREHFWDRVRFRRFKNAIAHEVWPGHHVQLSWAATQPRAIRKYRDDEITVEGWGLYSEALMREQGLWTDRVPKSSWRSLAFRAARCIAEIDVHTGRRDLEGAAAEMGRNLGAEGASTWLRGEIARYAADPGQALSYLVGQELILAMRDELTSAPGDLRAFHDAFLAQGSVPLPLIRERLLSAEPATSVGGLGR